MNADLENNAVAVERVVDGARASSPAPRSRRRRRGRRARRGGGRARSLALERAPPARARALPLVLRDLTLRVGAGEKVGLVGRPHGLGQKLAAARAAAHRRALPGSRDTLDGVDTLALALATCAAARHHPAGPRALHGLGALQPRPVRRARRRDAARRAPAGAPDRCARARTAPARRRGARPRRLRQRRRARRAAARARCGDRRRGGARARGGGARRRRARARLARSGIDEGGQLQRGRAPAALPVARAAAARQAAAARRGDVRGRRGDRRALIQATVSREFRESTLLTIAHRLETVVGYDRVVVLDAGVVVEDGAPRALLAQPGSRFARAYAARQRGLTVSQDMRGVRASVDVVVVSPSVPPLIPPRRPGGVSFITRERGHAFAAGPPVVVASGEPSAATSQSPAKNGALSPRFFSRGRFARALRVAARAPAARRAMSAPAEQPDARARRARTSSAAPQRRRRPLSARARTSRARDERARARARARARTSAAEKSARSGLVAARARVRLGAPGEQQARAHAAARRRARGPGRAADRVVQGRARARHGGVVRAASTAGRARARAAAAGVASRAAPSPPGGAAARSSWRMTSGCARRFARRAGREQQTRVTGAGEEGAVVPRAARFERGRAPTGSLVNRRDAEVVGRVGPRAGLEQRAAPRVAVPRGRARARGAGRPLAGRAPRGAARRARPRRRSTRRRRAAAASMSWQGSVGGGRGARRRRAARRRGAESTAAHAATHGAPCRAARARLSVQPGRAGAAMPACIARASAARTRARTRCASDSEAVRILRAS